MLDRAAVLGYDRLASSQLMEASNTKQIFSRTAKCSFETVNICSMAEECGCEIFSIVFLPNSSLPYEIWGKYKTSDQLIELDLKTSRFLDRIYPATN